MKIKKILLFLFALAVVASVFFEVDTAKAFTDADFADECAAEAFAFSDRVQPWNVIAEVAHGEKKFSYNLQTEIQNEFKQLNLAERATMAEKRGFYLGEAGKRKLYENLCKMELPDEAIFDYILPNFSTFVHNFDYTYVKKRDATVTFGKNGFSYNNGVNGVSVNKTALFNALLKSHGSKIIVQLPLIYDKAVTADELKQNTVKKGSFTTCFNSSSANRCYNIAKAAASLNGITVNPGETFSFNNVVGKRTEQNGYKQAKVIMDGNYTDGVGGGVCQVSTTLYNALLLSEIIPHACQHSLVSHYVMAGFDAMVSDGGADLTFTNTFSYPIYISANVDKKQKSITFCIYGMPNWYTIKRENEEIRTLYSTQEIVDKTKFPELIYTDQTKVVVNGSDGVKTKSYLCYYLDGKLQSRKLIRQNTYKKVDKIVARGYLERTVIQDTSDCRE